jgi:hypothetical protein
LFLVPLKLLEERELQDRLNNINKASKRD